MSQYFFPFPTAPHTKPHQAIVDTLPSDGSHPLVPRHSANPTIPRHLGAKRP